MVVVVKRKGERHAPWQQQAQAETEKLENWTSQHDLSCFFPVGRAAVAGALWI